VDYNSMLKLKGSYIDFNEDTGDAFWQLQLRQLTPKKQFVQLNVRPSACIFNCVAEHQNILISFSSELVRFLSLCFSASFDPKPPFPL
jgi:hypothetical protein